jgi:type I restriction-modification system DNA methylase subunit
MFLAADKLRKNLEPSDYKHVAIGLIFLKHISNAFEAKRAALLAEDAAAAEDPDEYLAENVFWVPQEALSHSRTRAERTTGFTCRQTTLPGTSVRRARVLLWFRSFSPTAAFFDKSRSLPGIERAN